MTSQLPRTLTARDVAVITVGTVIGSGIFLSPGGVMQSAGSVGVMLLVWIGGGILSLMGALCYSELGCMRPGAGGLYVYLRDAYGRPTAFVFGWTLFVVIASGSVATLAVAASDNLASVIPLGMPERRAISVGIIAVLAYINVRGTRGSTRLLTAATALKVAALGFFIVILPVLGTGWSNLGPVWPAQVTAPVLSGGLLAMVSVLWAYEGWQYATYIGGEVVEPQRNLPLGLVIGTAVLVVIYVMANVGYMAALGPTRLAASTAVASESMGAVLGPLAARLVAVPVLISIVSAAHGLTLTAARVFHAMAADGVFFRRLGDVHPTYGTPAMAIIALAAWSAVLAVSGSFSTLLTYVVFVSWIFYGLGGACVIVFRRREPDAPRPVRVPGYPFTPIVFVLASGIIVVNTMIDNPQRAVIGIGATLSALPIYALWRRGSAGRAAG